MTHTANDNGDLKIFFIITKTLNIFKIRCKIIQTFPAGKLIRSKSPFARICAKTGTKTLLAGLVKVY